MRPSIVILIPYFGAWPAWIDFFVESCRANRTIDWVLFGDAPEPENRAANVRFVRTSFAEYKAQVRDAIGIRFDPDDPYKLCDIRPALGHVHADLIRGYDFFGFGDIDVIYGDLRAIYDDDTLGLYDALSTHPERVSGHLFLLRNRDDLVTGYRRVSGWRARMEDEASTGFDEAGFYPLFRRRSATLVSLLRRKPVRGLFREAYTTPAPTETMRWYWKGGRLSNEFYPHRAFLYLHFMNWHSNRWYRHHDHIDAQAKPPWSRLPRIVQIDWREAARSGFMISPAGIEALVPPRYRG